MIFIIFVTLLPWISLADSWIDDEVDNYKPKSFSSANDKSRNEIRSENYLRSSKLTKSPSKITTRLKEMSLELNNDIYVRASDNGVSKVYFAPIDNHENEGSLLSVQQKSLRNGNDNPYFGTASVSYSEDSASSSLYLNSDHPTTSPTSRSITTTQSSISDYSTGIATFSSSITTQLQDVAMTMGPIERSLFKSTITDFLSELFASNEPIISNLTLSILRQKLTYNTVRNRRILLGPLEGSGRSLGKSTQYVLSIDLYMTGKYVRSGELIDRQEMYKKIEDFFVKKQGSLVEKLKARDMFETLSKVKLVNTDKDPSNTLPTESTSSIMGKSAILAFLFGLIISGWIFFLLTKSTFCWKIFLPSFCSCVKSPKRPRLFLAKTKGSYIDEEISPMSKDYKSTKSAGAQTCDFEYSLGPGMDDSISCGMDDIVSINTMPIESTNQILSSPENFSELNRSSFTNETHLNEIETADKELKSEKIPLENSKVSSIELPLKESLVPVISNESAGGKTTSEPPCLDQTKKLRKAQEQTASKSPILPVDATNIKDKEVSSEISAALPSSSNCKKEDLDVGRKSLPLKFTFNNIDATDSSSAEASAEVSEALAEASAEASAEAEAVPVQGKVETSAKAEAVSVQDTSEDMKVSEVPENQAGDTENKIPSNVGSGRIRRIKQISTPFPSVESPLKSNQDDVSKMSTLKPAAELIDTGSLDSECASQGTSACETHVDKFTLRVNDNASNTTRSPSTLSDMSEEGSAISAVLLKKNTANTTKESSLPCKEKSLDRSKFSEQVNSNSSWYFLDEEKSEDINDQVTIPNTEASSHEGLQKGDSDQTLVCYAASDHNPLDDKEQRQPGDEYEIEYEHSEHLTEGLSSEGWSPKRIERVGDFMHLTAEKPIPVSDMLRIQPEASSQNIIDRKDSRVDNNNNCSSLVNKYYSEENDTTEANGKQKKGISAALTVPRDDQLLSPKIFKSSLLETAKVETRALSPERRVKRLENVGAPEEEMTDLDDLIDSLSRSFLQISDDIKDLEEGNILGKQLSESDDESVICTANTVALTDGRFQRSCFAPPGKLGVIIDTTKSGPIIHELKASSPLKGLLYKGDRIIAVDDLDVRSMTASTLTRLMARKMDRTRKITVISAFEECCIE